MDAITSGLNTYNSMGSKKDQCGAADMGISEHATSDGGWKRTCSRSASVSSDFPDCDTPREPQSPHKEVSSIGGYTNSNNNNDEIDYEESLRLSCTPTIAPLQPSLAHLCLSSMETPPSDEFVVELLSAQMKDQPIHRMRTTSDILESARDFSCLSNPHVIQELCIKLIPGWFNLGPDDINIDQIMAGLSNQLFKVNIRDDYPDRSRFCHPEVLFRVYGKDVNALYDSETEIRVFKELGKRSVAPQLIAEFEGGRIEEWINGAPLIVTDMQKSGVLAGVAVILAGIHHIDLSKVICKAPCIQKYLSRWRDGVKVLYDKIEPEHPSYLAVQRLNLPLLFEESFRLDSLLFPEGIAETPVTQVAFCHCDLQENNLLVTPTCLRLIDFEYSGYNYPAYDIAAYFWEATCDYCVEAYPFFRIDPTKYPSLGKRRLFMAMYLSKFLNVNIKTNDTEKIDRSLEAVERFQLACHLLWGFWSVIRAPQAATATSFDMLHYAQKRIDAYWAQKAQLIALGIIPDDKGRWRSDQHINSTASSDSTAAATSAPISTTTYETSS